MLGLLKECDQQIQKHRGKLQLEKDRALKEKFRLFDKKKNLDEYFSTGENERDILKNAAQSHRDKCRRQNAKLCENSLRGEIERSSLNRVREEKLRQLLWKNAPELQDLRKMVLAADVCREQALQMAERSALRSLECEEKKHFAEMADREKAAHDAEEREKERREAEAKQKYHKELDDLLQFKRSKDVSSGGDEAEREKAAIDEMLRQIQEEDLREARAKMEKRNELRRQMVELQRVRDDLKKREKLRDLSESSKVDEYRRAQELRAKGEEEKRQLELEQRLRVQEELLDMLEQIFREKMKWEELRTQLAIEEKEVEERKKSRDEEMKRKKLGEDLQKVYDMQLRVKKQKEELQRKEDELFMQNMMGQLYEEDRLELMGAQRRRQKHLEHKRQVESLLQENRVKRQAEKAREREDLRHQEEVEADRARMIEEERIRFLKEHARDLLGYLPKRILTDHDTLEQLGEEFKKFYLPQTEYEH